MAARSPAAKIQAELAHASARDAFARARARVRAARARRAHARRTLTKWYRTARARLRERAKVYRKNELERVKREIAGWWAELRAEWQRRREQIGALGLRGVERASRVQEHERQRMRELAAHQRRSAQRWAEHRKRETQQESDEEVERNLEAHHPELVPVFREIRGTIKASPRRSRTEAMLEWAEENPDELLARKGKQDDDEIARMVREHQEAELELERARKRSARPPRLKFALGPVETLPGRYSGRTITVESPEGGRAVYQAAWDSTDTNPRPPLVRLEPRHGKDAPPLEVQHMAEQVLWKSLEDKPRKTRPKPARQRAAAVPF